MNIIKTFHFLLMVLFIIAIVTCASQAAINKSIDSNMIEVSLVPEKATFMLGEPIYVSFIVRNKSDQNLQVIVGGDYRNGLGRPESFTVTTIDKKGNKVPQPDAGTSMGGLRGPQKLPSKGQYAFQLFLPNWATFEKTGRYTITAQRILNICYDNQNIDYWLVKGNTTDFEVKASAEIEVVSLNKEKMGELIDQLANEMLTAKDDPAAAAAKKLENIRDERVIPHFIKALKTGIYNIKFVSLNALSKFENDDAFEALKYGLEVTGKDFIARSTTMEVADSLVKNIKHTAIHAISNSPNPKAIQFLLSKRNDEMDEIRLTVVHALGRMKADMAVPMLKEMQNDKNETIRSEVKRYLDKFASGKNDPNKSPVSNVSKSSTE
jgi:hypothetical protein